MGGRADVMVLGADGLAAHAEQRVHELEAQWSRFIETSDICRANRRAGHPTQVSPSTFVLLLAGSTSMGADRRTLRPLARRAPGAARL